MTKNKIKSIAGTVLSDKLGLIISLGLFAMPFLAFGQESTFSETALTKPIDQITKIVRLVAIALCILLMIWFGVQLGNEEKRSSGIRGILWTSIGAVIVVSASSFIGWLIGDSTNF